MTPTDLLSELRDKIDAYLASPAQQGQGETPVDPHRPQPTPHQPLLPDDPDVRLFSDDIDHAKRVRTGVVIQVEGVFAGSIGDSGRFSDGPHDDSVKLWSVPRRVHNPNHDPAKLAAFVKEWRAKQAPPAAPEGTPTPGEKPKLWREGQKFVRAKQRVSYPNSGYRVIDGKVKYNWNWGNDEGTIDSVECPSLAAFESAIASGELVPADQPAPAEAPAEPEKPAPAAQPSPAQPFTAAPTILNPFEVFAGLLALKVEEMADHRKRSIRVNGGDENELAEQLARDCNVLGMVAKIAADVGESCRASRDGKAGQR